MRGCQPGERFAAASQGSEARQGGEGRVHAAAMALACRMHTVAMALECGWHSHKAGTRWPWHSHAPRTRGLPRSCTRACPFRPLQLAAISQLSDGWGLAAGVRLPARCQTMSAAMHACSQMPACGVQPDAGTSVLMRTKLPVSWARAAMGWST